MTSTLRLQCFTGVRGDFKRLVTILTEDLKVAKYDFQEDEWVWTARDTTVVCMGNFVNYFSGTRLTDDWTSSEEAVDSETKIIETLEFLHQLARQHRGCAFLVLVGPHELGNLLMLDEHLKYQVSNPLNPTEVTLRHDFVHRVLRPFVMTIASVLIVWADFFLCTGGLSLHWLKRHRIRSAGHINQLWRGSRELSIFAEADSVIRDRGMTRYPVNWRDYQKFRVSAALAYRLNPKFILIDGVDEIKPSDPRDDDMGVSLEFTRSKKSGMLTTLDPRGQPDIFLLQPIDLLEIRAITNRDQKPLFFEHAFLRVRYIPPEYEKLD